MLLFIILLKISFQFISFLTNFNSFSFSSDRHLSPGSEPE
jgi:hypothetical protein